MNSVEIISRHGSSKPHVDMFREAWTLMIKCSSLDSTVLAARRTCHTNVGTSESRLIFVS